ncbi:unnamed protein product, partial [Darwinula stevensoni]
ENAQLLSKIGVQSFAFDLQVLCKTSALPFRVSIKKLFDTLSKSRILEDTGMVTSGSILSCTKFLVVPETIEALLKADIHVWVLTGDKQETAINIGYSCHLLTRSMALLIIDEDSLDATREVVSRHVNDFGDQLRKDNDCALIVNGKTLKYALSAEMRKDFMDLCISCKSVICCRVSPMQKAEIVELVGLETKSVTLAIGDGANDVAMIQKAHVGIGIAGQEGMQAVCASDYAIAQFRFLRKLLFVHGAWCYHRMCKLILYSFYKNICLYVIELWFAIQSAWSGQTLFDRWCIGFYNVLFTATPPFALGLFDRFCSAETMLRFPALYKMSQESQMFNVRVFWFWVVNALMHSIILYYLPAGAMKQDVAWGNGRDGGYLMVGNMVYTYVVVTVCLKAGLETNAWTVFTHLAIWGSIASWFFFFTLYANFWPTLRFAAEMAGMHGMLYRSMLFWVGLIIFPFIALLPDIAYTAIKNTVWKSLAEAVRESEIQKGDPGNVLLKSTSKKLSETARLLKNVKNVFRRTAMRANLEVELSPEKPSLAQTISSILSDGRSTSRRGFNGACSIHEWTGDFQGKGTKFRMTSVCGHVMTLDFIGKYNNWDRVDPAELFSCPTEKKEATPKLQMVKYLSQEARGSDYLILWLDCDKEGENICFEVITATHSVMNISRERSQCIFRAHFSALTDKDIKAAFQNLGEPNENEARSVDARQELDLRIGCAFTRFQTKYFHGKYGNLDSSLISFGPCQTPTLGFCVQRHDSIQSFKPEPYWMVKVTVEGNEGAQSLTLDWMRVRCFDKEVAMMFLHCVKQSKSAKVTSITRKEKSKARPIALNTVELMRVASSGLGMGPHQAMQIAERLYTQGYISYPRTETTQYPANFDLMGTLKVLERGSDWCEAVRDLLKQGMTKPRKGSDAGDHPPITPMKLASKVDLETDAWRLYSYVVQHFIGTVSCDCRYLSTVVEFDINGEGFTCTGKKLIDPGFTSVMTWQGLGPDEILPDFQQGQLLSIEDVKLVESETKPPDYLTEAELISLMEKHGIGTDASIPVHINNICQRNFVTVSSGRRLIPTSLGIVLVHGYQKIDGDLVLPTMRAAVEKQLNLIAHGQADLSAVLDHNIEVFKQKFHYFVKNIDAMDSLFEVSFSPLADSGKPLSRCGKCRRYMKYVSTKPCRLHCSQCDETYGLPQNGTIRLYRELKCPLDEFELLTWSAGVKGKSFVFCPYCYNYPPFKDMKKASGCNMCTHPTCPYSLNANGVSSCMECPQGILVLDPASGPKWKLTCNRCDVIIHAFEDAIKVNVLEDTCDDCQSQRVTVEYKPEKTKLGDGSTESTGCIYCSEMLSALVEKHHAMVRRQGSSNTRSQGRGRGRGRGGRARRGKPRPKPKDKMAQLAAYFV